MGVVSALKSEWSDWDVAFNQISHQAQGIAASPRNDVDSHVLALRIQRRTSSTVIHSKHIVACPVHWWVPPPPYKALMKESQEGGRERWQGPSSHLPPSPYHFLCHQDRSGSLVGISLIGILVMHAQVLVQGASVLPF